MTITTITYIHSLLKADVKRLKSASETARKRLKEYDEAFFKGKPGTDKATCDKLEQETQQLFEELQDAKDALYEFEKKEW